MKRLPLPVLICWILAVGQAQAVPINSDAFFGAAGDVFIDFEAQANGLATNQLAGQGVTFNEYAFGSTNTIRFAGVGGGSRNLDSFSTAGTTNTNPSTMFFASGVSAVGFHLVTNSDHTTTLEAYRNNVLVETQFFATSLVPLFVGISNTLGFDELRVSATPVASHVVDNLYFRPEPVPEPTTLGLLGAGLLGLGFMRRRRAA